MMNIYEYNTTDSCKKLQFAIIKFAIEDYCNDNTVGFNGVIGVI